MGKKEKYGNYLCKHNYFDIRQKIEIPRKRKLNNGEFQTVPGKVEVFVYHGKNQMAGPFKSKKAAIIEAEKMVIGGVRYNKHGKN
tara:strand:+ start:1380 stop:1634 length:255 start_codon:yes stop_codon:yes gene_type:complete